MRILLLLPLLLGFLVPANAHNVASTGAGIELAGIELPEDQPPVYGYEEPTVDPECESEDERDGMTEAESERDCEV